jgi:hypothetical protein
MSARPEGADEDVGEPPEGRASRPRAVSDRSSRADTPAAPDTPGPEPGHDDRVGDQPAGRATPLHPSVLPQGEAITWSAVGSLVGGPIVWGGVGVLVDRIFGTGRLFLALGLVVGTLTGLWIVYLRFGHDSAGQAPRDGT